MFKNAIHYRFTEALAYTEAQLLAGGFGGEVES